MNENNDYSNGWTLETTRQFLLEIISRVETLMDERQSSYQLSHDHLRAEVNRHGDEVNKMVTRAENDAMHREIDEQIDALAGRVTAIEGRSKGVTSAWAYLIAAISALGVLFSILGVAVGVIVYFAEH